MVFFSYRHNENYMDLIDVFVEHPFPFEEMWQASKSIQLGNQTIHVAGLDHMLKMKEKATRPKDEIDLRYLNALTRKKQED